MTRDGGQHLSVFVGVHFNVQLSDTANWVLKSRVYLLLRNACIMHAIQFT